MMWVWKNVLANLGDVFFVKQTRWSFKSDRPNITLYKLNFQRFVPQFCLVLMLIHKVCDACPFLCFFYIQKGVDIHGKPLTSHAKGPHGTSERREFEPGCALADKVTLLSHQKRGVSQQKIRLGFGGGLFGTPCIQEFGVELLFDRQGEQNSKKKLQVGGLFSNRFTQTNLWKPCFSPNYDAMAPATNHHK